MTDQTKPHSQFSGYSLAFLAALLWGVSGVCAQFVFQNRGLTPEWLVCIRLLIAGVLLLIVPAYKNKKEVLAPLRNKRDFVTLIGFSIFGMLAVQYTYFAAIKESNAATATILQFLGPVFIAGYYSVINRKLPMLGESVAIILALLGTFLIVTHGSVKSLSISGEALFWGIGSAIALATYSILPIRLLHKYGASIIVGWGMLLGGVFFSLLYKPWHILGIWDLQTYLLVAFIIIFGSAVAFISYLMAVKIVGATVASLMACAEPLSAAIIAVLWLNVPFGIFDWIGTMCIISTIVLLTVKDKIKL